MNVAMIKNCWHCWHVGGREMGVHACEYDLGAHDVRLLPDWPNIPNWCPLLPKWRDAKTEPPTENGRVWAFFEATRWSAAHTGLLWWWAG